MSSFTAHPYFHDKLPYDPKDLVPIARITKTVVAVSVATSLNVNSLKELEALARAKPGQLNWTTATGFTDFVFAGYLHSVGLKMAKVPYKNPAGAATDLAAGVIQVHMPAYAIVRPQVEAGRVKVLAVTNRERAPAIPDIPTAVEAGYPSLQFDGLVGLSVRQGLQDEVRNKIATDVKEAASDPELVKRLTATGQIVAPGNATEFAASIAEQRDQVAAVGKIVREQAGPVNYRPYRFHIARTSSADIKSSARPGWPATASARLTPGSRRPSSERSAEIRGV